LLLSGQTPALYMGGPRFKFQLRKQLPWLSCYLSVCTNKCSGTMADAQQNGT